MQKLSLFPATCGGTIVVGSKSSKSIMSPGYPTSYATNLDCEWRIVGPPRHYLVLRDHS